MDEAHGQRGAREVCEVGFILSSVGAWYLLRAKSPMIERAEVLRMVQASYEEACCPYGENTALGFRPPPERRSAAA